MKNHFNILIIDDNEDFSLSLKDILKENGFGIAIAPNRESALSICKERTFSIALIDIKLPDANGLMLVEELSDILPDMEYIVITGHGTIEMAIEAVKKKKIVSFEMKPLDMTRFLLLIHQVMERKQAAEALRMSEQRFQIFAESATDAIISIDHNGIIVYLNPEFENIFGYKNQEIIGNPITRLINPEDKKNSLITINKIIDGANIYKGKRIEIQGYHKSGKLIPLEISVGGFSTKEGKFYTAIVRDISERKKFDNQLIHTERMAGIGIMAAGMAHEINQPLNNISLSMDNLIISLKTGSKDQKYIDNKTTKIFDNVTRIRNIIDHLRDFSKDHDDYIQSTFSVNESILNAKSMIFEQFKHIGIQLSLKLDGTLPDPIGNTYKFEQVIVNLIINAKDAIEEKQNFLNLEFEKVVEIISSLEDSHICVEVKDTGIGIETKDLDKVMLPFYSTKKEGTGTGLGLSISFGIIRDMNGFIEIQSERLKGTTIRILIPKKKENPNQSEKV